MSSPLYNNQHTMYKAIGVGAYQWMLFCSGIQFICHINFIQITWKVALCQRNIHCTTVYDRFNLHRWSSDGSLDRHWRYVVQTWRHFCAQFQAVPKGVCCMFAAPWSIAPSENLKVQALGVQQPDNGVTHLLSELVDKNLIPHLNSTQSPPNCWPVVSMSLYLL